MSYEKQTVNLLILELATMVVAVAIAFGANFLTTFDLSDILFFIFATSVAIWFWWGYVMDRLEFPPRSQGFPFIDVIVLILIALIPFALHQGHIYVVSGTLAAILVAWALLIRSMIRENSDSPREKILRLRREVIQRFAIAALLVLDTFISFTEPELGFASLFLLYLSGAVAVVSNILIRRKSDAGRGVTGGIVHEPSS